MQPLVNFLKSRLNLPGLWLCLVLMLPPSSATFAQAWPGLPILRSNTQKLTYSVDNTVYTEQWTIVPSAKPDVLDVDLFDKKTVTVTFKSAIDSLTFRNIKAGQDLDFIVLTNGKDSAWTRISARRFVSPAKFSKDYIKDNTNKTLVEIPAMYELLNVVFALTSEGKENPYLIYKQGSYYTEVLNWFDKFKDEPIVSQINTSLKNNGYFVNKMDAYAFELRQSHIIQSKIYDRISWGKTNTLRPYIAGLEQFAKKTDFPSFFANHQSFYERQIRCYRDTINTRQMVDWLHKNFPTTGYNAFKIIFSPLVYSNQSANWFEDNGFKEAQAHVNFPYISPSSKVTFGSSALNLSRGFIVFTELNHSFINPELQKNLPNKDFDMAMTNLASWLDLTKPANSYNDPVSCFNEYMNWALISLYVSDFALAEDKEKLISTVEHTMKNIRGFKKFPEFDRYLVTLYENRKSGATIADLYPEIISWFKKNSNS